MPKHDHEYARELLATQTGRCTVTRVTTDERSVVIKQVSGLGRREAPLLRYVPQIAFIPVPRIIECRESAESTELVLTDAGRLSVHELNSKKHVVRCAALLGGFHTATQADLPAPSPLADLPVTFAIEHEVALLIDRMYYHRVEPDLCKSASFAVATSLNVLSKECPTCVIHGDPHLANWIAASPESDDVTLIDWAQARVGYGFVDLVRLLTVPTTPNRFTFDASSRLAVMEAYCDASGLQFPTNRGYRSAAALAIANSLNWQHTDAITHQPLRPFTGAENRTRKLTAMLRAVVTLIDFDN